jgi:predicted dienelactone hydrolase
VRPSGRRRAIALVATIPLWTVRPAEARVDVGVTTLTFTKTSVTTMQPRPLATVIWYPAVPHTGTPDALGRRDAAVRRGHFPLLVFSHGACGRPTEASYLTMALARRGFVVAAPPHPGDTADDLPGCATPDETVDTALNRVPDVVFTLDSMFAQAADRSSRFARRLRPDAVGIGGLSFGGFTTLLATQYEPRFVAALSLVPGGTAFLSKDITIPTMVVGAERDHVVGFAESQSAYARVAGPRFLVELLGANHLSVVDDCFNHDLGVSLCVPGDISQADAHRLVLHYAVPFLERYLAGRHRAGRALGRPIAGVTLTAEPQR